MRPRTKIQKRAEELSQTLLPLPRHIVEKFSKETPKCNSKVYYAVLEQKKEFSVVRYFSFVKHKKKNNVCREFMQVWVSAHGNAVRAKQRFSTCNYYDTFLMDSPMEIRMNRKNGYYNRLTDISYSKLFVRSRKAEKVICNYRENQFYLIGKNYVWLPDDLHVDTFPFLETILKQRPRVAELLLLNRLQFKQEIVKTAWKHGYLTEELDYNLWSDTVSMAEKLHYDLHNPFYVCPMNLQTTHNLYALRLEREEEREERRIATMKRMNDEQGRKYFENFIKKFIGFKVENASITIQPLKSIEEFKKEGEMMHHCVFACGYYKKPDTLILSAQVNGEHTETIEIDLKNFSIVQSRGVCNQPSEYHEEIKSLLLKNMYKLKSLTKKAA